MSEAYKFEAHHFEKRKRIQWQVCSKCGLIALRNDFTRWAIKKGCNNEDHPEFARRRRLK